MKKNSVIEVDDVSKIYRTKDDSITAIEDISFSLNEEEFVSIIGPSGCGKSTLLKIISGVLPKSKGSVLVEGTVVEESKARVGMVFQKPVLLNWRTIINNVLLPIEILRYDLDQYRQKATDLLELVGLQGFEDKYPHELSGGMQQRASISRALIFDPKLLLMDEPFGALDALTREGLNQELLRIWRDQKQTILFVTHNIAEAVYLSDRVMVMSPRPGKINDVFEIDLPRPRKIEMQASSEFGQYVIDIRNTLYNKK
jgi:NitT/TauT family transport system ATP-binding protein